MSMHALLEWADLLKGSPAIRFWTFGNGRSVAWVRGAVLLGLLLSLVSCEGVLGPEFAPTRSLVAIELPPSGADAVALSRVGPVDVGSGQPVKLHAVLVGTERESAVYYTSAQRLEIDGSEVPESALRPWPNRPIRCLWQTLRVSAPLFEVSQLEQLDGLTFTNFAHPDWGIACSAIATVTARQRETLVVPDDAVQLAFGVQSYQVWVELLERETSLVSEQSFKSPSSDVLLANPETFSRARIGLEGRLAASKRVFGLSQVAAKDAADQDVENRIAELHRKGLLFSKELLFAELVKEAEGALDWKLTEINGVNPFIAEGAPRDASTVAVKAGDLLRVADRFVVLFRDVGQAGVLDSMDLCFDYSRGPIVRRLGDVFVGDGDGDVEWAAR